MSRTPWIERLWWDVEAITWDDQLRDAQTREEIEQVADWATGGDAGPALDIGCGTGNYALALARRGCDVTAIDVSAAMLRKARAKASSVSPPPTFLEADLHAGLPFPDAAFAVVLCVHVLQVIREPGSFLADVRRVLQPGGRLALAAVIPDADRSFRRTTRRRTAFRTVKQAVIDHTNRIRVYDEGEITSMLERAGFAIGEQHPLQNRVVFVAA